MSLNVGSFEQADSLQSTGDVTEGLWQRLSDPASAFVRSSPEISQDLTTKVITDNVQSVIRKIITNSTTESVNTLQNLTTRLLQTNHNSSLPEVIINGPDVTPDSGIGTAEKVVIGAAVIVAVLAVVGLILRLLGPRLRSKSTNQDLDDPKLPIDNISSKFGGFTNFGAELGSQSSGLGSSPSPSQDWSQSTGSTPVSDWSEISSENAKSCSSENQSSSDQSEASMAGKSKNRYQPKRGFMSRDTLSVTSLPVYKDDDRLSSKSSPGLWRRLPDGTLSAHSTHSLEPLRLEQNYRDRWDDEWDPFGSLPRGNLSHLSHPSESRLSLVSCGSMTSSMTSLPPGKMTFPIPPRDLVRQIHMDKERRYPSNTKTASTAKKEKHVRLSPPTDRKH